ncbi:MAG: hypothetical protein HOO91_04360 [Bacteroidales bacterium]|nr:hypothetical protein [Bacteroidales bacterium]
MNRSMVLLGFLLIINSCKHVENPKEQFVKWAQRGVIINKVVCKIEPNQSYCLYLPTSYDVNKSYPVIYAFDPHGNGHIPVALMKNCAEKLGYIVVGSNISRNGLSLDEINSIINNLLADTQQKISIETNRIYTIGFSGGARVACLMAQYTGKVKGVIACSAGFQPDNRPLTFRFIGVAGTQDMNYLEMKQLGDYLESFHQPHQLLVFKGKHQWPPESVISESISMLELYAMKDSLIPLNKNYVSNFVIKSNNRVSDLMKGGCTDSLAIALMLTERTDQILDGLTDIVSTKLAVEELKQNPELQKYLKDRISLENYESQKQSEFVSSFGTKPAGWWKNEIRLLNDAVKASSRSLKVDMSKRLLGYISLSCYSYVNRVLNMQDWKAADYFTSIYLQVDPENPDSWYAFACLQANTSKPKGAIESLRNAIKFGFSDFSKLHNDPLLKNLHNIAEFNSLTRK